ELALMASDIIVEPGASAITLAPVKSAEGAETSTALIPRKSLACGLKRAARWLRSVAVAPVLDVGAFVEAQALLEMSLRTPFDDQDFLWRRRNQGVTCEPNPFAAQLQSQRDLWPF